VPTLDQFSYQRLPATSRRRQTLNVETDRLPMKLSAERGVSKHRSTLSGISDHDRAPVQWIACNQLARDTSARSAHSTKSTHLHTRN
jgi:hypothetical protein